MSAGATGRGVIRPATRLRAALAFAAIAGAVVPLALALRLMWLEQSLNGRSAVVLTIATAGAVIAAFVVHLWATTLARQARAWLRFALAFSGLVGAIFAATGALFAIVHKDVVGGVDPADIVSHGPVAVIWSYGSAAYLMFVSGWDLFFPLTLPLACLPLALLLARRTL